MPASGNIAGAQRVHTHSVAMCWAGCNRLAAIAQTLGFLDRAAHWNEVGRPHSRGSAGEMPGIESRQAFTAAFGSDELDASVLLLPELGVIEAERSALRLARSRRSSASFCATST